MNDAADHEPIIGSFLTTHIGRQMRQNPQKLGIAQLKRHPIPRCFLSEAVNHKLALKPTILWSGPYSKRDEYSLGTSKLRPHCELIGPRPTDDAVGSFGFGMSRGLIAAGLPLVMVAAMTRKRNARQSPNAAWPNCSPANAIATGLKRR